MENTTPMWQAPTSVKSYTGFWLLSSFLQLLNDHRIDRNMIDASKITLENCKKALSIFEFEWPDLN